MTNHRGGDFFETARTISVGVMLLAATLAMAGTLLDWVQLRARVAPLPGADFGGAPVDDDVEQTEPFTGIEVKDGWVVLGAGIVLAVAALLVVTRGRGAWLGFVASLVIGAVTIADYRAVGDPASAFSLRTDIGLEAEPAIGLILCAAGGIVGLLASVATIAATPRGADEDDREAL